MMTTVPVQAGWLIAECIARVPSAARPPEQSKYFFDPDIRRQRKLLGLSTAGSPPMLWLFTVISSRCCFVSSPADVG